MFPNLGDALGNTSRTENNAVAFRSTLNANLDFFSLAGGLRMADRLNQVVDLFSRAFSEWPGLALINLFHLRNIRGGAGEREAFRLCLEWLANNAPDQFISAMHFIPEYGRWDDVIIFAGHGHVGAAVQKYVLDQLRADWASMTKGEGVSLLAKWMPSENASSPTTRALARAWAQIARYTTECWFFGASPVNAYRRTLSRLRAHISLVETAMSNSMWSEINYAQVPSRAMMIYRRAFRKHDPEGFQAYMEAVAAGKTKINAAAIYPYEIISRIRLFSSETDNAVLEAQWAALKDFLNGEDAFVVADTSGSMAGDPFLVSISLALYAAMRNKGPFRNRFITFSDQPSFVELPEVASLLDAYRSASAQARSGYNTNFQRVFDLILDTAVRNNIPQEGMPTKLFVISDMQFDQADGSASPPFVPNGWRVHEPTNFEAIRAKFEAAGYRMPTLIFWNVRAVPGTQPVTRNQQGALLASGLSPVIFEHVMQASELVQTPHDLMMDVLARYTELAEAFGARFTA